MKKRYKPIERDRASYSFDNSAFGQGGVLDELVADKIGQEKLICSGASQVVIEVEFGRKDVVYNANEASALMH